MAKVDKQRTVNVSDVALPILSKVKSLGVTLDSQLSFKSHVNAVSRACHYHIWALRHIRHLLTQDVAHTLARSIVMSKLDYCNAVLYESPKSSVAVLQRVQNSLARVVLQQKKYASVSPLLQRLHWLPIENRIRFKLAAITYKVRSTKTPAYLGDLLSNHSTGSSMTLRSSSRPLLSVGWVKTVYGGRAFRIAAPTIWNNLPVDIQLACSLNVFKKRLKTFLFTDAYDNQ